MSCLQGVAVGWALCDSVICMHQGQHSVCTQHGCCTPCFMPGEKLCPVTCNVCMRTSLSILPLTTQTHAHPSTHTTHHGATEPHEQTQEEEARLKPGTLKSVAFAVMKARGVAAPVSADDIVRISTTDGSRIDWPDKSKRTLSHVRSFLYMGIVWELRLVVWMALYLQESCGCMSQELGSWSTLSLCA